MSTLHSPASITYNDCVVAWAQRPGTRETVTLVVHGVARLTDKRRLAIGRYLVIWADLPIGSWEDATDETRLRWTRTHMGTYPWVEVETLGTGYTTAQSCSGGYPAGSVMVRHIDRV